MAFSSVALVAGVAALTTSLFKNKELRVNDIVELSKLRKEDIDNHPQLKIMKNAINTHITGIKDPTYHDTLIEIMATHNKPVNYFNKLDGRLIYSEPDQLMVVKKPLLACLKDQLKDTSSAFASLVYLSVLLFILKIAIEIDASSDTWMKAAAIILAGLGGMIFSQLLTGLSVQWRKNFYQVKDAEYQNLFDEYATNKKEALALSKNTIDE